MSQLAFDTSPERVKNRAALRSPAAYLCLAFLVIAFFRVEPIFPKNDDGWFFLVSYSWLNGLGFDNHWISPIGSTIFNWHGFLQPMAVASLSPCGTLACVGVGLGLLQALNLLLWTAAVETVAPGRVLRLSLYAIGLASTLQFSARPELLASAEMVLLFLGFVSLSREHAFKARAVLAGVLAGLVALTDPSASILVGLASAVAILCWRPRSALVPVLTEFVLFAVSAAATIAFILAIVYPHGAMVWLSGMREHSRLIANRVEAEGLAKFYIASRLSPLLAVMFVPLALAMLWSIRQARRLNALTVAAVVVLCLAFAGYVYWSAMRIVYNYYNFNVVVPTLSLIVAACLLANVARPVHGKLALASLALFGAACTLAIGVVAGDKLVFFRQQNDLKAEIAATVQTALDQGRRVVLDTPLIQAIDDISTMKRVRLHFFGRNDWPENSDILLRAQTEFGRLPDAPPGWVLVSNGFDQRSINTTLKPESLFFAVYERR